ncbi:hypothetical protein IEQ34_013252 [Dendrobium chrysotoxum]|uniref:Uncharacterized protein n=1 Tax=Dendrobium chrysotoxum TaxID=161865 RepID=A0AAV7GQX0_DENCH|nr:hypothetical protein IEQ34_013252 [Dendrobium chrysotoxum]
MNTSEERATRTTEDEHVATMRGRRIEDESSRVHRSGLIRSFPDRCSVLLCLSYPQKKTMVLWRKKLVLHNMRVDDFIGNKENPIMNQIPIGGPLCSPHSKRSSEFHSPPPPVEIRGTSSRKTLRRNQ